MVTWNICVWIKVSEWTAWASFEDILLGLIWWISFLYMELLFHHTNSHHLFKTKFFQTFIPNYSETKHIITYWYSQHTRYGFEPISFRVPASHYFRDFGVQCIIEVESFLNFLNAVLTSYQPPFQSAVIWN